MVVSEVLRSKAGFTRAYIDIVELGHLQLSCMHSRLGIFAKMILTRAERKQCEDDDGQCLMLLGNGLFVSRKRGRRGKASNSQTPFT